MASDIDPWALAIVLHNVSIFLGNSPARPSNSRSYANHSLACALERPLPNDVQRKNLIVSCSISVRWRYVHDKYFNTRLGSYCMSVL